MRIINQVSCMENSFVIRQKEDGMLVVHSYTNSIGIKGTHNGFYTRDIGDAKKELLRRITREIK